MKHIIVENGVVTNIVESELDHAARQGWIPKPDNVEIGWFYDGENFTAPPRNIEAEWNQLRAKRNQLLIDSDKNVLYDRWVKLTTKQQDDLSNYRQKLRDIPTDFADPKDVIWPEKPQ